MYDVIVSPGSSGFVTMFGFDPAASATIIVSPTARDAARMDEATIPESAAGTMMREDTSSLVAPSPYAPSRIERGTDRIESSESEAISGMIITPTAMDAANTL